MKNEARNSGNAEIEKGGKNKEERVKGKVFFFFKNKIVKEECLSVDTT